MGKRPAKGSPEAKAWGERMKAAREASNKLLQPKDPIIPPVTPAPGMPTTPPVPEEVVGAKLSVPDSEIKSMLEDITEDSEVQIYNPLSQGFRVQFTVTAPQPVIMSPEQRDIRAKAGIQDKDIPVSHNVQFTTLPPNKITRLPGKVAHIAIKQLRNYLIGLEDNNARLADPVTQRQYEERIIMKISNPLLEVAPQVQDPPVNEQTFPSLVT